MVDLTNAYPGQVTKAERRVSLLDRDATHHDVVVRDIVEARSYCDIRTGFTTSATVSVNDKTLTLTKTRSDGVPETYYVRLVTPSDASWSVTHCKPWLPETMIQENARLNVSDMKATYTRVEVDLPGLLQEDADVTYVFSTQSSGDVTPPSEVEDLDWTVDGNTASLSWTAPGDDGDTGTVTAYDIRFSSEPITDYNWSDAMKWTGQPSPILGAGQTQSCTVQDEEIQSGMYFAVRARDENYNWSWISR